MDAYEYECECRGAEGVDEESDEQYRQEWEEGCPEERG